MAVKALYLASAKEFNTIVFFFDFHETKESLWKTEDLSNWSLFVDLWVSGQEAQPTLLEARNWKGI